MLFSIISFKYRIPSHLSSPGYSEIFYPLFYLLWRNLNRFWSWRLL